jgi:glycosyltransferase involved in cell wall biosynthesis
MTSSASKNSPIKSVALIDPLGDFGIGGYTYELAEGLATNGVSVDVYTAGGAGISKIALPRHHRVFTALGTVLYKQRALLRQGEISDRPPQSSSSSGKQPDESKRSSSKGSSLRRWFRRFVLPIELAVHLKKKHYDVVWTQWPLMDDYGPRFWLFCKCLRMRVVHTVHNVLPHEEGKGDRATCGRVYKHSDVLIVTTTYSANDLAAVFPKFAAKTVVAPQGIYTIYPRMQSEREKLRAELRIRPDQIALLVMGGVRPYKNTDAILHALARLRSDRVALIVSGKEWGYSDLVPGEPLGRTRRIAAELGILDQIRFIPGLQEIEQMSELLEAADVLMLPYLKSYGSGALLLGMTFGKHILATTTGGMDEYLAEYPARTIIKGPGVEDVLAGIEEILKGSSEPTTQIGRMPSLEWKVVAGQLMQALNVASFR